MKTRLSWFARLFAAVMLCFSLLLSGFVVARSWLDFTLDDTERSLDTSRGRERKQQKEYDEVVAQLPLTRAELAEVQPMAEEAAETVRQLKEERKQLREEKKELEQAIKEASETAQAGASEQTPEDPSKNPSEEPSQNPPDEDSREQGEPAT